MGSIVTEKVKLLVALVTLQFCFAGFHIVSRLALNIGVSKVVYPVYRNLIALLLLSPLAYFLEKWVSLEASFSLFTFFLSYFFYYFLWICFSQCLTYQVRIRGYCEKWKHFITTIRLESMFHIMSLITNLTWFSSF